MDGNGLFRAVSYFMHNNEARHKIKLRTLNKVINELEYYKFFIVYLLNYIVFMYFV